MITPTFELPDVDRRSRWGWGLLLPLLILWMGTMTAAYLSQDKYDLLLKAYVVGNTPEEIFGEPTTKSDLEKALAEIEANPTDPEYSALYSVTIRGLLDKPPRPGDLHRLQTSRRIHLIAVAEIYSTDKLPPKMARLLGEQLEEGPFALQVAKDHAYAKAGIAQSKDASGPDLATTTMAGTIILFLVVGGVAVWILYAVRRSLGRISIAGIPGGRVSPAASDRYAARAGLMLLFWILVQFALFFVADSISMLALGIIQGVSLGLLAVCVVPNLSIGGRPLGAHGLGLGTPKAQHGLWAFLALPALWAMLIVLIFVSLLVFRGLPPPEHPISAEIEGSGSIWTIVGIFFVASILAPIWEEITFRGFLFPALTGAFRSPAIGVLLSSFCFAAIHPTGIPAWPMLAAVGAMCAMLYYHTGSLWPAIFLHCFHNTLTLAIALLVMA